MGSPGVVFIKLTNNYTRPHPPQRLLGNLSGLFLAYTAAAIQPMSTVPARPHRQSVSRSAVISHNGWMTGCSVADISVGGARLLVSAAVTVPDQFELQTTLSGSLRRCRTVWREEGQVGVEFVDWV